MYTAHSRASRCHDWLFGIMRSLGLGRTISLWLFAFLFIIFFAYLYHTDFAFQVRVASLSIPGCILTPD